MPLVDILDGNGNPDWIDQRLAQTSSLDTSARTSFVSPVCLEGRGMYPTLMALAVNGATNVAAIRPHIGPLALVRLALSGRGHKNLKPRFHGVTELPAQFRALSLSRVRIFSACVMAGERNGDVDDAIALLI